MIFDSQPYLVLEYVEGKRIDDYCRERQLPLKARLKLFLQTARAIAFAHQSLVLHRDLKPSNILITPDGAARVLDFGIAKALEQGQTVKTDLTLVSGRALTLDSWRRCASTAPPYPNISQVLGAFAQR